MRFFSAHYAGSFTVENSLTGEPMTFLPQGRPGRLRPPGPQGRRPDLHLFALLRGRDPPGRPRPRPHHQPLLARAPGRPALKRMFVSFGEQMDVLGYQIDVDFQPDKLYLSARARMDVRRPARRRRQPEVQPQSGARHPPHPGPGRALPVLHPGQVARPALYLPPDAAAQGRRRAGSRSSTGAC